MTARLLRSDDFERLLKTRTRAVSPHFALHHLGTRPSRPPRRGPKEPGTSSSELSTGSETSKWGGVEQLHARVSPDPHAVIGSDSGPDAPGPVETAPDRVWLGAIVPKRHARRSVTRSLLKRQIRAAVDRHAGGLPNGLWVVRLRSPFDRAGFPSAASDALKRAARTELEALLGRAAGGR